MKFTSYVLPVAALGAAALLVVPAQEAMGFSTLGHSQAINTRDVRVFNNFGDASANNNTTKVTNFPGWDGAELAIWKGAIEWNSLPHGDGSGDPTQGTLGNGGANFDAYWAGSADAIGDSNDNVVSAISSCGSGVLAFAESGNGGWRIRFCEAWSWQDGPGNVSGSDLQGVGCHEYGHALGLGHSTSGSATMFPSISGTGVAERSINSDDIAGIKSIYGSRDLNFKPIITGVSVSGTQVTVTGSNFSLSGGEVWFTHKDITAAGVNPRVRITGVAATSSNSLTVTIPVDAGPGNILVKRGLNTNNSLSNSFPFDAAGSSVPLLISFVSPSSIPNLIPGTAETVSIFGDGFTPNTGIEIDGTPILGSKAFFGATIISFEWEPLGLGPHTLSVVEGMQTASTSITAIANATPTIQAGDGDSLNVVSGSVPLTMSGQPGDIHYMMVSPSNAPSVLPGKLNLGLGATFSQIFEIGVFILNAEGLATTSVPLTGISNVDLYWQALRIQLPIALNYPLLESNLQSTHAQ